MFTPQEQARLGEVYAPVLFAHRDDVAPVSPAEYIRRSALWSDHNPVFPGQTSWGSPVGTPDLASGAIAARPDDADIDQRTLLATFISGETAPAFFLDHGGWDLHAMTSVQPLPQAGVATQESENLMGSAGAAHARWDHREPHPELDPHVGWYSVQAYDTYTDIAELRDKLARQGLPVDSNLLDEVLREFPGPTWMIFYHFFFPYRCERVTACEFITTLETLGLEVPFDLKEEFQGPGPSPPGVQPGGPEPILINDVRRIRGLHQTLSEAGLPYSLPWATHLGQFVTVGLVVPAVVPSGVAEAPGEVFQPPLYVGFGQSAAVKSSAADGFESYFTVPLMEILSAPAASSDNQPEIVSNREFMRIGNHPLVYLSPFTHNTRPRPGDFPMPASGAHESVCNLPRGGKEKQLPFNKKKRNRWKFAIAVAKFLTMGLVPGSASFAAELSGDPELDVDEGPTEVTDSILAEEVGLVLAPADLVDTLAEANENATVRAWQGDPEQHVFDQSWENPRLRWGPPALTDPFRRRQGQPMPRYERPFIDELARHLESES